MKKVLIIVGVVCMVGFLLFVAVLFKVVSVIRHAEGPALYSSLGASTRIQEYARASGKTNYIAYANQQVALIQDALNGWQKTADSMDTSNLEKMEAAAYATTDKNIKNGLNPLAFLDNTNLPSQFFSGSTNQ